LVFAEEVNETKESIAE
jgi:hypothetical protein